MVNDCQLQHLWLGVMSCWILDRREQRASFGTLCYEQDSSQDTGFFEFVAFCENPFQKNMRAC
jgi:hypothetical protein